MNNTITSIYVKTDFYGFHRWPEAPEKVAYLRELHRHLFGVRVDVNVTHDNRDVEFHTLLSDINSLIRSDIGEEMEKEESLSCEQIAKLLLVCLEKKGYSVISVEINEDGECGAIVCSNPFIEGQLDAMNQFVAQESRAGGMLRKP